MKYQIKKKLFIYIMMVRSTPESPKHGIRSVHDISFTI